MRNILHRVSIHRVLPAALWIFGILGLTLVSAPLTMARGAATQAASNFSTSTVKIIGDNYLFDMPSTIHAGLSRFIFINTGLESHQAQFFKFKPGYGEADLLTALNQFLQGQVSFQQVFNETWLVGGIGSIEPAQTQTTYENLSPGRYEVMCFDTTASGEFHFMLGMYKSFTVSTSSVNNVAPHADGELLMSNLQFTLPAAISRHQHIVLKVYNAGPGVYEFSVFKLNPGVTYQQYLTCINSANCVPPVTDAGGIAAIQPGLVRWVSFCLTPGTYVVASFVPDPATGYYDANEGMVATFTVK